MRQFKYITTHNGLRIMERFYMSKCIFYKGVVFIVSVVEGLGLMSTHRTEDEKNKGGNHYRKLFWHDHEVQLRDLYDKAMREEKEREAQEGLLIHDAIGESKQIIKQTSRLLPGDLKD